MPAQRKTTPRARPVKPSAAKQSAVKPGAVKPGAVKPGAVKPGAVKQSAGVQRLSMSQLRTLGADERADGPATRRARRADETMRKKARGVIREEFERIIALKEKLEAEQKIGATEKGRAAPVRDDKVRSLVASLEGMNRFALRLGLLSPAESREIYTEAMKRGLYAGWH